MVDKHVRIIVSEHGRVAGSVDVAVASKQLSTAALHHRLAGLVDVRPSDTGRATDHGAVSALYALAAAVERDPEIEVVAVFGDVGSLDGAAVVGTSGDGDEVVRVDGFAGRGTQLDELQTAPERAEGEPPLAVSGDVEVGVDGIVVAVVGRFDD